MHVSIDEKIKINRFFFSSTHLLLDINGKSLHQQLYELKVKTQTLRNDFVSIRRMQQSLQENFKTQLHDANKKIGVRQSTVQERIELILFFLESYFKIIS